jgi:hypothetical protein
MPQLDNHALSGSLWNVNGDCPHLRVGNSYFDVRLFLRTGGMSQERV